MTPKSVLNLSLIQFNQEDGERKLGELPPAYHLRRSLLQKCDYKNYSLHAGRNFINMTLSKSLYVRKRQTRGKITAYFGDRYCQEVRSDRLSQNNGSTMLVQSSSTTATATEGRINRPFMQCQSTLASQQPYSSPLPILFIVVVRRPIFSYIVYIHDSFEFSSCQSPFSQWK